MNGKCEKCKKSGECGEFVKNGHHHGKQRYIYKKCGHQFIDCEDDLIESEITKSFAITLYLVGVPYKKTASIVKQNKEKILKWAKERGVIRKSDPEITREEWHKKRCSFEQYMSQEGYRIKRNRIETDVLKKIYSVPKHYGTPIEKEGDFIMDLNNIINYMNNEKSKSVKRFVVFEVHRYSGEVKKVMYTP